MRCPSCDQVFSNDLVVCPADGTALVGPVRQPEDLLLGAILGGQYRIVDVLGEGGMGVVYRARQESVGRDVALKVLRRKYRDHETVVRRFENEAKIISQLRHPNTLRLYDVGRTEAGDLYIVTELLHGCSLRDLLKNGPISIERTLSIAAQICGSLSEAHGAGIVHRDLKPENVFLDRVGSEDYVKVLDFGIAKLVHAESFSTLSNTVLGTPAYMSPERARAEPADQRSDVYALGVLMYEILSGRTPFVADNPAALLLMHICDPPPPLSELPELADRPVPPALEDLIMHMLAKAAEDRPSSVDEVRERLHEIGRAELKIPPAISSPGTLLSERIPAASTPPPRPGALTPIPPWAPPAASHAVARRTVSAPDADAELSFGMRYPQAKWGLGIGLVVLAIAAIVAAQRAGSRTEGMAVAPPVEALVVPEQVPDPPARASEVAPRLDPQAPAARPVRAEAPVQADSVATTALEPRLEEKPAIAPASRAKPVRARAKPRPAPEPPAIVAPPPAPTPAPAPIQDEPIRVRF